MKKEKTISITLLIIYLILLTWIILFKIQFSISDLDRMRKINLIPFYGSFTQGHRLNPGEIMDNIILFIPVGAYIRLLMAGESLPRQILPIFLISLIYEVLQFILAVGVTDVTDLIDNTFGGIIGIVFIALLSKIFTSKTQKIVNRLAMAGTVLVVALIAFILIANQ